ncbi:sigma 54-interacting transcriptional regulator [Propionispira raffinosivorans]|uniref:sigma 54-interacting transcriptional regulator n=1 Tax=Propionispira raffinosivorans TaxID=86959 RepID=UPI00036AA8C6|nr:sigma-54-dependent transcriptional regulator [Propionispira raffinosivorans]
MKRIDKIYEYIKQKSSVYTLENLKGRIGVDATEIADELGILRNNVSMELNALHRQDKIIKIIGRPVLYFDKQTVESLCGAVIEGPCQFNTIEECVKMTGVKGQGPFDRLIGADRSLKKQVEQAKAAILYPPDGLHTLIVGQTGVGKTLFAHMMYEYGKTMNRFPTGGPFITFNCADYYNNPQLLISHIFGHIKGAFTGADTAKEGLVEAADKGVLFLDEIHRLPPEGQEMIFYFIDTGTFNRLGETTRERKAKVLLIGATTEDPNSALTKTFVRRIPNIITIRPLMERSLEEKVDIIKLLLTDEVQRINKPVKISVESIKALLGSISNGNVGQLKSNIKLLCAKAFLNGIDNPNYIEIDFKMLPPKIKNGLLTLSANRKDLAELSKYINEPLLLTPPGEKVILGTEDLEKEPFNLYQIVEDKVDLLKGEGISDDLIKQIVATDVNVYIKSFYNKQDVHMSTRERLLKIVDKTLVDFTEEISLLVQNRMNRGFKDRFLYAFSLHLSAFLKRVKSKDDLAYSEIEGAIPRDSLAFQVAVEIKEKIEEHYHIEVPRAEIEYFALLLESVEDEDKEEKVIIMVATHGKSTATSMVEVAQKLFSTNDPNLIAIDMPLEVKPQETLEKMISRLQEMNYQQGVLVLADMGSLCNLGSMIMERLKVQVKTIDMVSTPLILEAMRKADIVGMDLSSIYESLLNFKGYEVVEFNRNKDEGGREVIVTICTSGAGAAVKLKEMIEEILLHIVDRKVEVIPVGIKNLDHVIRELAINYKIVAAIGMIKPNYNIPFIPLEKLIEGDGETILRRLLKSNVKFVEKEKKNVVVQKLCEESLQKFLTYLNPIKVMSVLLEFDSVLEKKMGKKFSNPIKIRLIVHCGCALERMVIHNGLVYTGNRQNVDTQKFNCITEAASVFERSLKIKLTEDEIYYMTDMI